MKIILALTLCALVTSGCASPPKVFMPKDKSREPVNNEATISSYTKENSEVGRHLGENQRLRAEISSLNQQLKELREYIRAKILQEKPPKVKRVVQEQHNLNETKPFRKQKKLERKGAGLFVQTEQLGDTGRCATKMANNHTHKHNGSDDDGNTQDIVVKGGVKEFIAHFSRKGTKFDISDEIAEPLLSALKTARKVSVVGRTSARTESESNRRLALTRAMNARAFLINNGVAEKNIRTFYLSAGDNIADNSTKEGQSMNRRVEIRVFGLKPPSENKNVESKTPALKKKLASKHESGKEVVN